MSRVTEVQVAPRSLEAFAAVLGDEGLRQAERVAGALREKLGGRAVWNVNTASVGGGVAEMLRSLLGYTRGVGIDTRWVVVEGSPEFFGITKRLHHALHGSPGGSVSLGEKERRIYEATLQASALELAARVQPGDIVLLHDPQTAGLAPHLVKREALVIWRCHIGHDTPGPDVETGWAFLRPYLEEVPAFVFSRAAYVPEYCNRGRSRIIQPSIDAFSAKNQELSEEAVRTILVHVGLVEGPPPTGGDHGFLREDGTPGRVERRADTIRLGRAPQWETPLVVQVSRWDPLKDPLGVMRGFASLVDGGCPAGANLVLAGPNVHGVADDPEQAGVLDKVLEAWRALPHGVRDRIHVACLPTADVEENAAIVNALQRHAAVVVQKSLHEGFGLTVTEAMWKERPVVASAVGGIQDQIEDGISGILLKDPADLAAFAAALRSILEDEERARRLGRAARARVKERYLGVRHLVEYARLIEDLDRGRTIPT